MLSGWCGDVQGHEGKRSTGLSWMFICSMKGQHNPHLKKMVYLQSRRFLPEDHPLRSSLQFPEEGEEHRPAPETITDEDRRLAAFQVEVLAREV